MLTHGTPLVRHLLEAVWLAIDTYLKLCALFWMCMHICMWYKHYCNFISYVVIK